MIFHPLTWVTSEPTSWFSSAFIVYVDFHSWPTVQILRGAGWSGLAVVAIPLAHEQTATAVALAATTTPVLRVGAHRGKQCQKAHGDAVA